MVLISYRPVVEPILQCLVCQTPRRLSGKNGFDVTPGSPPCSLASPVPIPCSCAANPSPRATCPEPKSSEAGSQFDSFYIRLVMVVADVRGQMPPDLLLRHECRRRAAISPTCAAPPEGLHATALFPASKGVISQRCKTQCNQDRHKLKHKNGRNRKERDRDGPLSHLTTRDCRDSIAVIWDLWSQVFREPAWGGVIVRGETPVEEVGLDGPVCFGGLRHVSRCSERGGLPIIQNRSLRATCRNCHLEVRRSQYWIVIS